MDAKANVCIDENLPHFPSSESIALALEKCYQNYEDQKVKIMKSIRTFTTIKKLSSFNVTK